jgi:trimeric autotransporter adhesin
MAYTKYSLTPADNNAAPPNGAPEGMLPSAVNDTMRDMMSQIRDAGDGIRGGTYTMTAPVITGGSITGVALSGNTLTSPVITGGSISGTTFSSAAATITGGSVNGTTVGASTASTGAFTTLAASGATTLSSTLGVTGVATFSAGTVSAPAITTTGDTNTGIFFPAADTIAFTNGGTERMRINSSGSVGIGTNNPNVPLDIVTSATIGATCISISSGNSDSQCAQIRMINSFAGTPTPQKSLRVTNQGNFEIVNSAYTNTVLQITDGGSAFNITGTYGTISDVRVKDNVETAREYLSDLCRLRVVKYSLKSEKSEVPTKLGFVAQEVEQVFPNMIESSKDSFSGLDDLKQIKLSVLTPMLVKAIQELKAELDSVKAELATLKA